MEAARTPARRNRASRLLGCPRDILESVFTFTDVKGVQRLALTCRHMYICIVRDVGFWRRYYVHHYPQSALEDHWLWARLCREGRARFETREESMTTVDRHDLLPAVSLWIRLAMERKQHEKRWMSASYWERSVTMPGNTHASGSAPKLHILAGCSERLVVIDPRDCIVYVVELEPLPMADRSVEESCHAGLDSTRVTILDKGPFTTMTGYYSAKAIENGYCMAVTLSSNECGQTWLFVWRVSDYQLLHWQCFTGELLLFDICGRCLLLSREKNDEEDEVIMLNLKHKVPSISTISVLCKDAFHLHPMADPPARRLHYFRWLRGLTACTAVPTDGHDDGARGKYVLETESTLVYTCTFAESSGFSWRIWDLEASDGSAPVLAAQGHCATQAEGVGLVDSIPIDDTRVLFIGNVPLQNGDSTACWLALHSVSDNRLVWEAAYGYSGACHSCVLEDRDLLLLIHQEAFIVLRLSSGAPVQHVRRTNLRCQGVIRVIGAWCLAAVADSTRPLLVNVETGRTQRIRIPELDERDGQYLPLRERLVYSIRGVIKILEFGIEEVEEAVDEYEDVLDDDDDNYYDDDDDASAA
ncbi:hypothetical protein THASP1DRAFT_26141 [Thamnocephalis sphaerospora]|uniref:F-box domain-containing protein n=1 Tax=Thamnocephalis sphaerospora TaxID=78915 RepID=A0A4P9XI50_9FUNG|nr:hypothetical protein THASP1DRAFT_26141 [Thamnocephalis sphaerospora]|eukprot:RKP05346.1 hypothetical protein THASP1DRAFT_26141 [Thamnocephalis sphaerospora]